ncbi:MAG: Asp-tRNA(Asn)/Glu-tRNA(Gln) amidotransferase subunit GatB [Planctomycetota bacterium]
MTQTSAHESAEQRLSRIASVQLIVGMEIHVELSTRTKMFTRAPSPASLGVTDDHEPNSLVDPVVLALPGTLPVMNRAAVEQSMLVGVALGCSIADTSVWDRKSYFYPDLPKAYQISQYEQPLCFDGAVDVPAMDDNGFVVVGEPSARVGIIRAHLEEDAGKLLHEAPGGRAIAHSIVDLNRAGTPLLEIVTAPDLRTVESAVAFCRLLHTTCRFLGVTAGVLEKGHMRFEPNINCVLTLDDARVVRTPIAEIKNLNSFRAVAGAIRHELAEQPKRWAETGEEHGPAMKSTRGWDDHRERTFLQRSKEDALDYRYFPDPDLVPVVVDDAWRDSVRAGLPTLPPVLLGRYRDELGLADRDAQAIAFERASAALFDAALEHAASEGLPRTEAARLLANLIVQTLGRLANERGVSLASFTITPTRLAQIVKLRAEDAVSANAAERLVEILLDGDADPRELAEREGLMQVTDTGALEAWADEAIAENPAIAEQIRGGKQQAVGRLIGEVMKRSGGQADAKAVRAILLKRLGLR